MRSLRWLETLTRRVVGVYAYAVRNWIYSVGMYVSKVVLVFKMRVLCVVDHASLWKWASVAVNVTC